MSMKSVRCHPEADRRKAPIRNFVLYPLPCKIAYALCVPVFLLFGAVAWSSVAGAQADPGLVAHYRFDEGAGAIAKDSSGHGSDGEIHGARYVQRGEGFCLEFDGIDDFVDCGNPPALDFRKTVTLEAWVFPESRVMGEAGILGKHFEGFLITYYADGKCWWYVSGGGNHVNGLLTPGCWHHVVGTFDGSMLCLYVDGRLADTRPSKAAEIRPARNFLIGCVLGDPSATDPAYTRTSHFPGKIDEVRVYDRALSAEEVRTHFEEGVAQLQLTADYQPAEPVETIQVGNVSVRVTSGGQVHIVSEGDAYLVESAYSYPNVPIGWNVYAGSGGRSEPQWSPEAVRFSETSLGIAAEGRFYRIDRTVRLRADKVEFEDRITNTRGEPTGFIVRNSVIASGPFSTVFTPGSAENPVIFLAGGKSRLGVLAEDSLSRIRFEANVGLPANQAKFSVGNFALDAGKDCTLRWTVYVLERNADYFDLVNRVRRDWNTNFTIEGPFCFFDVGLPLLRDPEQLKAYLQRKKLGIAALSPWLDYDPGSFDQVWPRHEYKTRMQEAARLLKEADPAIKCIGCIETDWVTAYPDQIKNGDKLPRYGLGSGSLNAEQTCIIDEAGLPWKDSVKRRADGGLELELYGRGGKPQMALCVYPRIGNYQYEFLMGQVKFLLEEVGLDGFYIDEFSQGWRGGIPSYEGWDGVSAEVNPATGEIRRTYVDCSLAGIDARVKLCRYALDRGKIVVANTYATSMEEQALPVFRFSETQGAFDPMATPDGAEPPAVVEVFRGDLATPIGLGILGVPGKHDAARRLMKAVVTYLRHGALYYHYAIEDIPETGEGSGDYGPINHMFPITPVALHKGWVEGKERIVTAISGEHLWRQSQSPQVRRFDLTGREHPADFPVARDGDGWRVAVQIRDWAEIVVIE